MVPKDTTLTTEDSYSELATLTFLCTRAWSVPERAVPAPVSPIVLSILISVSAAVQKKQIAKENCCHLAEIFVCVCMVWLITFHHAIMKNKVWKHSSLGQGWECGKRSLRLPGSCPRTLHSQPQAGRQGLSGVTSMPFSLLPMSRPQTCLRGQILCSGKRPASTLVQKYQGLRIASLSR